MLLEGVSFEHAKAYLLQARPTISFIECTSSSGGLIGNEDVEDMVQDLLEAGLTCATRTLSPKEFGLYFGHPAST